MNSYEITFLVAEAKEADNVKNIITSLEGKIVNEKAWGTQQLAYQIEKKGSMDYFTWNVEIDSKNILELKNKMNFHDNIVRYIILKKDEVKKIAKKEPKEDK